MKMRMTASLFLTRPVALLFKLPFGRSFELVVVLVMVVIVVVFFNWRILSSSSVGELWWHNLCVNHWTRQTDKRTKFKSSKLLLFPDFNNCVYHDVLEKITMMMTQSSSSEWNWTLVHLAFGKKELAVRAALLLLLVVVLVSQKDLHSGCCCNL